MAVRIQLRGDTAANWTSVNPTLAQREVGLETDTNRLKIGDGTTAWASLAYSLSSFANLTGQPTDNANLSTALAAKQALLNSATALVDGATIDLTAIKHTLTTAASRTFTISYTGDDITLEVTLTAASATQTFPATALCVSEGVASGDNTLAMSGTSGDKYMIAIKKVGSAYYVVCKNFGQ